MLIDFTRALVVFLISLLLTACQSSGPSITLEDAKKITARLSGQTIKAPPRSINTILTGLERSDLSAGNCTADDGPSYSRIKSRIKSYGPVTDFDYNRIMYPERLSDEQFETGAHSHAVKLLMISINQIPQSERHNRVRARNYSKLAAYLAITRDYEGAKDALSTSYNSPSFHFKGEIGKNTEARKEYWRYVGNGTIAEGDGDLVAAEAYFRQAAEERKKIFVRRFDDNISLYLSRNLMLQNRLMDAEVTVRDWLDENGDYGVSGLIGYSVISEILYEQGRYADAEKISRIITQLFQKRCIKTDNIYRLRAENVLVNSLVALGRWKEVLEHLENLKNSMRSEPGLFDRLFSKDPNWALALLNGGKAEQAITVLRATHAESQKQFGDKHYKTAEIEGFLALALAKRGDRAGAEAAFQTSVDFLLQNSRNAGLDSGISKSRSRHLGIILEAYMSFLAEPAGSQINDDAISTIFKIASASANRSVQSALAASGARAALNDPELSQIARREQDAQKQLSGMTASLTAEISRHVRDQDSELIKKLRAGIQQLRLARKSLRAEIASNFPKYEELRNPKPVTLASARADLNDHEAMIVTYVGKSRTFVWAFGKTGAVAFNVSELSKTDIHNSVSNLRQALDPGVIATLDDIPAFDVKTAYHLYSKLLHPVVTGWGTAKSLMIVADGPLGQLPMSLLPTKPVLLSKDSKLLFDRYKDVPWLARTHNVTVLPSIASLKALRGTRVAQKNQRAFVGFGDPFFSKQQELAALKQIPSVELASRGVALRSAPQTRKVDSAEIGRLPRLPDTRTEIEQIARVMKADPVEDVYLGKRASEDVVKSLDLKRYRIISFATHGLIPGDLNGLDQPALALSSPKVAGGKGDGLLTMGEILGLKLNADWAVLSACNTAAADGKGAEAISGLGRAFFYAGARALLVSNWPVHSGATATLMTDLFQRQALDNTLSRAEALRNTRNAIIDDGGFKNQEGTVLFSYAHPIFWAPFTVVGDGGRSN
jgi:CHAT domain-containing protein